MVEKFNAPQQLTAMLTPSMLSMMSKMIDALFVDEQIILAAMAYMKSVTAVMNSTTLHRTSPARFVCQGHHATKTGLIQGNATPTPKGTDHIPPLWAQTWETFQLITIMLPFLPQQEQQFQKAHILFLIQPLQLLTPPSSRWMPPSPLIP